MPKRIQRHRMKGWRMPFDSVYVGRPTKWGNPYKPGQLLDIDEVVGQRPGELIVEVMGLERIDLTAAIALYRCHILGVFGTDSIRSELAGHDLVCWCPLDAPCHADVLLELANGAPA